MTNYPFPTSEEEALEREHQFGIDVYREGGARDLIKQEAKDDE